MGTPAGFKDTLTMPQRLLLIRMRNADDNEDEDGDDEAELVHEPGAGWWNGTREVDARVAKGLLQCAAIRDVSDTGSRLERYRINETGRALLAR